MPPPVAPAGTTDEYASGTDLTEYGVTAPAPVGLGFRVPLLLISPWTRGGWVTSEVADHTSVLQFIEKWTTAIGTPAICPNISDWRRAVSSDLVGALDFQHPVYGLPDLPFVSAPVGEANSYEVLPSTNALPAQEPGNKPARALPYQQNASLAGFTANADGTLTASLALSNNAPFAAKSSVFTVYDNLAGTPSIAAYPTGFPGSYTVAPSQKINASTAATVNVAAGAYDITVVSSNRFLRRFTGDTTTAGATASVTASYYAGNGFGADATLILEFANAGDSDVTFTVTHNHYVPDQPASAKVHPGASGKFVFNALGRSGGWYDVTVTIDSDSAWSQRFTGHIENGKPSVTGSTVTA